MMAFSVARKNVNVVYGNFCASRRGTLCIEREVVRRSWFSINCF